MTSTQPETAVDPAVEAVASLRSLRVLVIGFGIRWFGFTFYSLFLLAYLHSAFGLSYVVASLYIAAIGVLTLPLGSVGGGISDTNGRRRIIVLSLAGQAVGLGVVALGFTINSLLVVLGALFVSRSFGIIGTPAVIAYVGDSTDVALRAKGLSWVRVGQNAGVSGGVAVGGLLLGFVAYGQVIAFGALMIGAAAIANAAWLTPSVRDRSLASVVPGSSPSKSQRGPRFLRRAGQTTYASLRPIWRDQTLFLVVLTSTLVVLLMNQIFYGISTFGLTILAIPSGIVGVALALNGLIPALTQVPLTTALKGHLHTRVGIWGVVAYAASFIAIGLDAVGRVAVVLIFVLVVVVSTFAENMVYLPVFTLPLNIAPEDSRGTYSGAMVTAIGIGGSILAPLLAGVALSYAAEPLVTWGILAAPAIPAIALLWYLDSHLPREANRI